MQTELIEKKIKSIEDWLEQNEGQMFLPTMEEEDLLHKKDVQNQKNILDTLKELRDS